MTSYPGFEWGFWQSFDDKMSPQCRAYIPGLCKRSQVTNYIQMTGALHLNENNLLLMYFFYFDIYMYKYACTIQLLDLIGYSIKENISTSVFSFHTLNVFLL